MDHKPQEQGYAAEFHDSFSGKPALKKYSEPENGRDPYMGDSQRGADH
jgi:hypothetical protein